MIKKFTFLILGIVIGAGATLAVLSSQVATGGAQAAAGSDAMMW